MTNAKPPRPDWLTHLLASCTASEQKAITLYRCHVGRCHHLHRKRQLNRHQVVKAWTRALTRLEGDACGSPKFDKYVRRQYHHLEEFLTGVADSGKPA